MSRIISLEAENIKRLKAVKIEPAGENLVVVSGENAQGKTSVLDSIEMALAGTRSVPDRPIREGKSKVYGHISKVKSRPSDCIT